MTKMIKRFTLVMVLGIFSSIFIASQAQAAELQCTQAALSIPAPTVDDPGTFVPPRIVHVNAASTEMQKKSWRLDSGPWTDMPSQPTHNGTDWDFLIPAVPHAGTVLFIVNGHNPSVSGYCQVQALPAISTPLVVVKTNKKGKPKVTASFTQNRSVSTTMTVTQRVKKGKKRKTITKQVVMKSASQATLARKIKLGKVAVQLTVIAQDCTFGPAICTLHSKSYKLKATNKCKEAKKKCKKRKK